MALTAIPMTAYVCSCQSDLKKARGLLYASHAIGLYDLASRLVRHGDGRLFGSNGSLWFPSHDTHLLLVAGPLGNGHSRFLLDPHGCNSCRPAEPIDVRVK